MKTTITEDSGTNRSLTQTETLNDSCDTGHAYRWKISRFMHVSDIVLCASDVNTHSDPDESPSTVPALMLMATPFS